MEGSYARAALGGHVSGNVFWRHQPDNIATAPADVGMALRYGLAF